MDAQWKVLPRRNTSPGVFKLTLPPFCEWEAGKGTAALDSHLAALKFAKGALAGA